MQHFPDGVGLLQLVHLLDDEVMSVLSLMADLLLDWPRIRTNRQVMLNNFPWNSWEIRGFLGEHIRILPQEYHEFRLLPGGQLSADDDAPGRVGSQRDLLGESRLLLETALPGN